MKKEIAIFSIVVLILVILSGCEGFGFGGSAEFNPDVHVGSEGLRIELQKNTPPEEIYEDEDFKIVARFINKGAYVIESGILTLMYEQEYVELLSEEKINIDLRGKDVYNMWDDEEIKTFTLKTGLLDPRSEIHTSLLLLTSCYNYETIASFQVCIDTNIYETRPEEDKICIVKDLTSSGQGGPLVVAKIEPEISGADYVMPSFKIYIQNNGRGEVVRFGKKEEACAATGITGDDYNIIDLEEVELSTYKLSNGDIICSPDLIRIRGREAVIRCYLAKDVIKSTDPSFVTSLKIHLKYTYTQTESMLMDILNDPSLGNEGKSTSIGESEKEDTDCASKGCCKSDKGGVCKDPCNSNTCSGVCMPGYCAGGTSRVCCVPFRGASGSW